MIRMLGLVLLLAGSAVHANAQTVDSPARAGASITIERSLTVASVRPMIFHRAPSQPETAALAQSGEAVIRVTGDPGRVYRVSLPSSIVAQPGDLTVDTLTIVSENSGDITQTLTARMDSKGLDRLHISGLLRQVGGVTLTDVTAAVPVGVDYE